MDGTDDLVGGLGYQWTASTGAANAVAKKSVPGANRPSGIHTVNVVGLDSLHTSEQITI